MSFVAATKLEGSRLRLPALSLSASFIGWIVIVVVFVALVLPSFPHGLDSITPQAMVAFRGVYLFGQAIIMLPVLLGMGGIVALFAPMKETKSRAAAGLMLASALGVIALFLVLVVIRLSLAGFNQATLGENSVWNSTAWAFDYLAGPAMAVATLVAGIALFTSGMLRRTGLVIAILSAALGVVNIAGVILPPFAIGFLWLTLGIGLLRRR